MTDLELNTRIAEFVGWTELHTEDVSDYGSETRCLMLCGRRPDGVHSSDIVDDYAHSVDAWMFDVVPLIITRGLCGRWSDALASSVMLRSPSSVSVDVKSLGAFAFCNAPAKTRCEALVKVLDERGAA